jgi:hypothetical protein
MIDRVERRVLAWPASFERGHERASDRTSRPKLRGAVET